MKETLIDEEIKKGVETMAEVIVVIGYGQTGQVRSKQTTLLEHIPH
jgi:hypothetical protein